jgi:hypothetical protein
MAIANKLATVAENVSKVYKAGKDVEHNGFWEKLQNNGNPLDAAWMFSGAYWSDDIYDPQYPIYATRCLRTYFSSFITDTKVPIVVGAALQGDVMKSRLTGNLMDNTFLPYTETKSGVETNYSTIEIIRDLQINSGIKFSNTFAKLISLKHMKITGTIGQSGFDISSCTLASPDTIQSVLEACIRDFTGGTTLTITLPSTCSDYLLDDNGEKMLDEKGFPELRQEDDAGNKYNTIDIINKYPKILEAYNAATRLNYTIAFN